MWWVALIAVVHAYSRKNWGDSLLVDLSRDRIERAGIARAECELFALDASSFSDWDLVHQVGTPDRGLSGHLPRATLQLVSSLIAARNPSRVPSASIVGRLARADAAVGVGGGYLRAQDAVSTLGCLLNHVPQLVTVARSPIPSVYLPQSIGPLRARVGKRVAQLLRDVGSVCVRDDRSLAELEGRVEAHRFPDLVVLHIAENLERDGRPDRSGDLVLVARDLGRDVAYEDRLRELARLTRGTWATQAEGRGTKSDARFYRRLGFENAGRLEAVLNEHPSAVASVRLHGALQSIVAGVPAIHLSYDRKGWGAYSDLGLDRFVHDVRSFDPRLVADQIDDLRKDPSLFWRLIEDRREGLLNASERLTELVRRVVG